MEIKGYKAFKKGLLNKYGRPFIVGEVYSKNPDNLVFGENGHGYHMCSKLADTFRFFNPVFDNDYCEVVGFGNNVKQDDFVYDSDSMYVVEKFKIVRVLSREDIFKYVLDSDIDEFRRFLELYPFSVEELNILRNILINRESSYLELFNNTNQNGDILSFKRNPKYLRKVKGF